ncbi:MAG: hypothetical protein R3C16_04220 [Hyphomonadaceae bacterium]
MLAADALNWSAQGPQIWLNAVDLYNGAVFTFTPQTFNALCSDLGSVRVGDAVAAASMVPGRLCSSFRQTGRREACAPLPAWIAAQADRSVCRAALWHAAASAAVLSPR